MTLFLIFAVAIVIVLLCFQYWPANTIDIPKYKHDVAAIEYVLDHPDVLISQLGFPAAGTWYENNKIGYDYIMPIDLYTRPGSPSRAYFIDIAGENGYMILDSDYNLYQYQTTGDYPHLTDSESIYFSPYDGIIYQYKDKTHLVNGSLQYVPDRRETLSAYTGQRTAGDGDIFQPNAYIADRYGSKYYVNYSASLPNFNYVTQGDTSIYYRGRGSRSEGNCTLNAIYNALNYISNTSSSGSLPTSTMTTRVDAKKDAFYGKYASDSSYVIDTPKTLPTLYASIREYAIRAHGYEVEALTQLEVEDVINNMLTTYESPLVARNYYSATYFDQVMVPISKGLPVLNNVTRSVTYGSHSMVVTGYQVYQATREIGDLHYQSYILMLQVADGWSNTPRYYDANFNKSLEIVTVFMDKRSAK